MNVEMNELGRHVGLIIYQLMIFDHDEFCFLNHEVHEVHEVIIGNNY